MEFELQDKGGRVKDNFDRDDRHEGRNKKTCIHASMFWDKLSVLFWEITDNDWCKLISDSKLFNV